MSDFVLSNATISHRSRTPDSFYLCCKQSYGARASNGGAMTVTATIPGLAIIGWLALNTAFLWPAARSIWLTIVRCQCAAASRSNANEYAVRQRDVPGAQPSIEICQFPAHPTATPLALRQASPSTSGVAGVRVLLPDRQARSGRSRAVPRSDFRLKPVAAPTKHLQACDTPEVRVPTVLKLEQVARWLRPPTRTQRCSLKCCHCQTTGVIPRSN